MEEFIFLISVNRNKLKVYSPLQLQDYLERWLAWRNDLLKKAIFISGESLDCGGIKISGNGEIFTQIQDCAISSLVIIKAPGIEEAATIALACPVFRLDGSLEIRQIFTLDKLH